jgi:hypothetical protein
MSRGRVREEIRAAPRNATVDRQVTPATPDADVAQEVTGTHALMLAVLEEGIRTFLTGRGRLRDEAEFWILSHGKRSLFSFVVVCEHLGLDPDATRSALRRMRSQSTAKNLTRSRPNVSRTRRVLR